MRKAYFNVKMTNAIKGVMLILMYILHFFCFPSWYVGGSYPNLQWMECFQGHFQICVAGFTFLTGYFYYYSQKGTFRYIVKKWVDIYVPYWCVFFVVLCIAVITQTCDYSLGKFILELFGLKFTVMSFCWYVTYYLLMIPVLVFMVKFLKNDIVLMGSGLILPMLAYYGLARFMPDSEAVSVLSKFQVYFPITLAGFLSSKNKWFEFFDGYLRNKRMKTIIAIAMVLIVFMEPSWLYGFSASGFLFSFIRKIIRIFSIPLFVYGIISILRIAPEKMRYPLELIGVNSAIMWFFHVLFFNCSKEIFQPILYSPRNPVLVLIWGIILNLCIAIPINGISKRIRAKVRI